MVIFFAAEIPWPGGMGYGRAGCLRNQRDSTYRGNHKMLTSCFEIEIPQIYSHSQRGPRGATEVLMRGASGDNCS